MITTDLKCQKHLPVMAISDSVSSITGIYDSPTSQRLQRPAPAAYSREETANRIVTNVKKVYKDKGSYLQLLPGVGGDQMHIADIYTKVLLRTREGVAVNRDNVKEQAINSIEYGKIFGTKTRSGDLIKRLVFVGEGGVGKTTIFDKIAYDWAEGKNEKLKEFVLVVSLKMCAISQTSDLDEAVF